MRLSDAGLACDMNDSAAPLIYVLVFVSCILDVGTVPTLGSDFIDEHEADIRGSTHGRVGRINGPKDDGAVGASFFPQSSNRSIDDRRRIGSFILSKTTSQAFSRGVTDKLADEFPVIFRYFN